MLAGDFLFHFFAQYRLTIVNRAALYLLHRWKEMMMENVTTELIKITPSILWFLLVVTTLVLFYQPICNDLLPRLGSFEAAGLKLLFITESINAAIELADKSPQWQVKVSPEEKECAIRRAKAHLAIFKGVQILWVDDHPENNLNERRMFRHLNTDVDIARSTEEALQILENARYDFVISDMVRGNRSAAGLEFLQELRKKGKKTPVIYYVGIMSPEKDLPVQAFGITNRPDELLHLVLDVLERTRSQK